MILSTKVGKQMIETLRAHTTLSKQQIKQELIHYMTYMKLKDPQSLLKAYPYMLSGGMLQRMMIALALALKPKLIIADEPTTALDTITQYEVINAFKDIKHHFDCAMIFISHDLTVINKIADRVVVMREASCDRRSVEQIWYYNNLVITIQLIYYQLKRQFMIIFS